MNFAEILGTVTAYYGLSFAEVKELPVPAFWALAEQIPRLRAKDDLRLISAVSSAMWGGEKYIELLEEQAGQGMSSDTFDREGLEKFRGVTKK